MDPRPHWLIPTILILAMAIPTAQGASKKKELRRWTEAQELAEKARTPADRIEILEAFVLEHPKSTHVPEALRLVEGLRFEAAMAEGTTAPLVEFMDAYPESPLAEKAAGRLRELRFNRARFLDTEGAYREFLIRYPEGPLAEKARERQEILAFASAEARPSLESMESFIHKFKTGPRVEEAQAWIDEELAWLEARAHNTPGSYTRYLDLYPSGRRSSEGFERNRRLLLRQRMRPLLGAWAMLELRTPPDMKQPHLFIYLDSEDRIVFYTEARALHGGEPVATSYEGIVDGPPVLLKRMYDTWQRSVREVNGSLLVEESSPRYSGIRTTYDYRLQGNRLLSDKVVREGLPYKEEYERMADVTDPKFRSLLDRSLRLSARIDAEHSQRYR